MGAGAAPRAGWEWQGLRRAWASFKQGTHCRAEGRGGIQPGEADAIVLRAELPLPRHKGNLVAPQSTGSEPCLSL